MTFSDLGESLARDGEMPTDAVLIAALLAIGLPTDLIDILRDEVESHLMFPAT